MLKAIIFDVDGVLVDSREANLAFLTALMEKAGYADVSTEEIHTCFHLPLRQSIEKLTKSKDKQELERVWDIAQDSSLRDNSLFEFPEKLEEVLEILHDKYKLAIVTSRIKVGVENVFTRREIKHLFEVIVTFEDYANPKPHPEPLEVAMKKLNVRPDEAIYIGDSPTDIEAAENAGMKSIFLNIASHKDATAHIQEFSELLAILQTIEALPST